MNLGSLGLHQRVHRCRQCNIWIFAACRHQDFCSFRCQQKHYRKSGKLTVDNGCGAIVRWPFHSTSGPVGNGLRLTVVPFRAAILPELHSPFNPRSNLRRLEAGWALISGDVAIQTLSRREEGI
jgi:hypothetical protein